ncbi:zinc finger protein 26-like isoform X2 [Thrips palmi]|uniref:Zinc finger protein 26-like isoform X2 n=1 Tax=Thrips palmi TaxID=161013 RepID=A0A6P9AA65_THRPL|nr:zinc finger protein 26-like isoform X2 [Thrips palmi]
MSSVFVLHMDGPVREERRSSPARSERQDPTVHRELRAAEPPPEQHLQELDSSAIDLAEETGDASGAQHHEIASQLEGSTPDKCGKCAADFPSLAKMVVKVPTLTGKKPMQWTVCVKLSEVMDLRRRFGVRDAATPLECTFCHTKLPVIDLEKHLISHAFQKPFKRKCSVCHEKFTATESLIAHFRRERMFVCKVCDMGFGRAALLAAHLRTHSVDKQMIGQLHRTSSEQDVAQCAACAADYPSLSKMVASVRTHTEQKPLECSVRVTLSEAEKLEGRLTYRRGPDRPNGATGSEASCRAQRRPGPPLESHRPVSAWGTTGGVQLGGRTAARDCSSPSPNNWPQMLTMRR